jgi:hypothetical protein
MLKLCGLFLIWALPLLARHANWTGPYSPCLNSNELRKTGHMRLGVRYDISNAIIVEKFHHAFAFWAKVLDAEFFDEQSTSCAIAVVGATKAILDERMMVARSQFVDRQEFSGWIAVDPMASTYLKQTEAVAMWIHEIGHLLGLKHSRSARSLMYYIDVDADSSLEPADLRTLASLHALRPILALQPIKSFGKKESQTRQR